MAALLNRGERGEGSEHLCNQSKNKFSNDRLSVLTHSEVSCANPPIKMLLLLGDRVGILRERGEKGREGEVPWRLFGKLISERGSGQQQKPCFWRRRPDDKWWSCWGWQK